MHEPCLRENLLEPWGGGDREAAHLDQRRLAGVLGERPEQVEEQGPGSLDDVPRGVGLEPRHRVVKAVARDDLMEATDLGLLARGGRQARPDCPLAPNPVPPEPAQLVHELRRGRLPGHHVSEAARIAVEAAFDRDHLVARVAAEQSGDHVRAAAPGATHEDDVGNAHDPPWAFFARAPGPTSVPSPVTNGSGFRFSSPPSRERSRVQRSSGAQRIPSASSRATTSS